MIEIEADNLNVQYYGKVQHLSSDENFKKSLECSRNGIINVNKKCKCTLHECLNCWHGNFWNESFGTGQFEELSDDKVLIETRPPWTLTMDGRTDG